MKMLSGGEMHQYPPEDECPHKPGSESQWQESFVLVWWDKNNAVGGYCRVGHEPNHEGGLAVIWAAVHTPGESWFRNSELPITDADRMENGMGAGSCALIYEYDGQCKWHLEDKDLSLSLTLEDFHPAIDGYMKDGQQGLGDIQSNHVEVACRVVGTLKAKSKTYNIDGLCMRDHGWGARNWSAVYAHRWNVGVFDKDNSFCAVSMHLSSDEIKYFGWVVRGDQVIHADEVNIVAHLANDAATNVGGHMKMKLSNGENFEVKSDPVAPGALFYHHGICCVDTLCQLTWGDRAGVGVFETSSNLQSGLRRPEVLDGGLAVNGWHSTEF